MSRKENLRCTRYSQIVLLNCKTVNDNHQKKERNNENNSNPDSLPLDTL